MFITTLHETTFDYHQPIRGTWTQVRIWPVSDAHQTCHSFSLSVDPLQFMTESEDYHGNKVMTFNILPLHHRVVVSGHSVVATHRKPFEPNPLSEFDTQRAHMDYLAQEDVSRNECDIEELVEVAGLRSANREAMWFEPDSTFVALQNLNRAIFENFTFDADATHVHTTIEEVFALKRGVCQDFAHVFIAVCRAAGFPARYVSGYLVTRRSRSAGGTSASHAWAEVLVPNHGWCEFDPTNNLLANDSYIKLAVGRDYRDVPPTQGLYNGRGIESRLGVRIHTLVQEDELSSTQKPERELVG